MHHSCYYVPMRSIWAHPWDITPERVDMLATSGVDEVMIATLYHAATFVDPNSLRTWSIPSATAFVDVPQNRPWSPWIRRANGLNAIAAAEHVRKGGLRARAWIVLLHDLRSPQTLHIRTLAGDRLAHATCPSNPEAQDYASSIVATVADSWSWDGVDVEGYGFYGLTHLDHHAKRPARWSAVVDRQLSICFCPRCVGLYRDAGIDVPRLRTTIRRNAVRSFAGASQQQLGADEGLPMAQGCRRAIVAKMVRQVQGSWRDRQQADLRLFVHPDLHAVGAAATIDPAWSSLGTGYVVVDPNQPSSWVGASVESIRRVVGPSATILAGLVPTNHRVFRSRRDEATLSIAGASRIGWYHMGLIPQAWFRSTRVRAS